MTATIIPFPVVRVPVKRSHANDAAMHELTDAQLDRLLRDIAKEMREEKT